MLSLLCPHSPLNSTLLPLMNNDFLKDEELLIVLLASYYFISRLHRDSHLYQARPGGSRASQLRNHYEPIFYQLFGLSKATFNTLEEWLYHHSNVRDSYKGNGPTIAEKLQIFLHYVRHGSGMRETCNMLNRSEAIVSR